MDFNLWGWGSPVAWAVFLIGVTTASVLLAWAVRIASSAVQNFVGLSKRR